MTPYLIDGLQQLGYQTLVLGAAVALLLVLRRPLRCCWGARFVYAVWILVPLLMLAAIMPSSPPGRQIRAEVLARLSPALPPAPAPAPAPARVQPAWPWWLAGLWVVGVLMTALRFLLLQRRYLRGLQPAGPHCLRGTAGSAPALVGLWRARLAVPADFETRFGPQQQLLVLAHEQVHRQRADNLWNAIAAGLCVLHWFNPLAWLAAQRMRADQELACDAAVMTLYPGQEAVYGRALMKAQATPGGLHAPLPWSTWSSVHPLVERIDMLKHHRRFNRYPRAGLALLCLLAFAGIGTVHALQGGSVDKPVFYDLQMDLSFTDAQSLTLQSQPRVVTEAGKPAKIILGGTPQKPGPVVIEVTPRESGDGAVSIAAEIKMKRADQLETVSRPRLITGDGERALISIETRDASVRESLRLYITPRRTEVLGPSARP